ncbi:hypothetical protein PAHAL_5G200300 [Panicum hallii]|uniref:Uncharacterized protein n=1 Tax=Panicum hallii TaxID=206008 RepID=A0A2S3HSR3_9POAL|nr:hypothetical protein PAHAL_5G200300 [Panicum hallii]
MGVVRIDPAVRRTDPKKRPIWAPSSTHEAGLGQRIRTPIGWIDPVPAAPQGGSSDCPTPSLPASSSAEKRNSRSSVQALCLKKESQSLLPLRRHSLPARSKTTSMSDGDGGE